MTASDPPNELDLLQHRAFLMRLARRLVADTHSADDLVQDTLRVALERPPRSRQRLGAWLSRVMRHLSINRAVADARRRAREREIAGDPDVDQAPGVDAELAAQRDLLEAVAALDEPLRVVIHLRYFHDLGPSEIGARLRVPTATVKSRLVRARARLRDALSRRSGDDPRGYGAILAPLLRLPANCPAAAVQTGALVMTATSSKVAVGAAAVSVCLWWAWPDRVEPSLPSDPSRDLATVRADPPVADSPVSRAPILAPPPASIEVESERAPPPSAPAATVTLVGVVLDAEARPVPFVPVGFRGTAGDAVATSAADGTFRIESPRPAAMLAVRDERWFTLGAGAPPMSRPEGHAVIVVAPATHLTGVVVDAADCPVAGASLSVALPEGFRRRFDHPLDATLDVAARATSADSGRFDMRVPLVADSLLLARREGFVPSQELLGDSPDRERRVVLSAIDASSAAVTGTVVDLTGSPVADARVSFGGSITRTDAFGRFILPCSMEDEGHRRLADRVHSPSRVITALKEGYLPAVHDVSADGKGALAWPQELVLQLGGPPLSLAGWVIDPDGEPVAGALVWVEGLSYFSVEGDQCVETAIGQAEHPRMVMARADDDGAFEVGGLLPRDYRLVACDAQSFAAAPSDPTPAGRRDVVLVIDRASDQWGVVSGVVVDENGAPLPDAGVAVMIGCSRIEYGGAFIRDSSLLLREVPTDASGGFLLREVGKHGTFLYVSGPGIVGRRFPLADLLTDATERDDLIDLRLEMGRRSHVKVTLVDPSEADAVSFVDDAGLPVEIRTPQVKSGPPQARARFTDGETEVLSVGDGATQLVLWRGEDEVRRVALSLSGDGVHRITP